jgi:hypothetical protein
VAQKIKHLTRLLGLGADALIASVGSAATFYGLFAIYDVKVSVAFVAACAVAALIFFARYATHAKQIRQSFFYLWRNRQIKFLIRYAMPYGVAVVAIVFGLALLMSPQVSKVADKSTSTQRPPIDFGEDLEKLGPRLPGMALDLNKLIKITPPSPVPLPVPRQAGICALGETFTAEEFESCLKHIRRHPPTKGIGGHEYDLVKDKDKWVLRQRERRKTE